MHVNFRSFALLISAWITSGPAFAANEDYELDFQSSQAVFRAIEACKAEECDLNNYRFSVREDKRGIEVILIGKKLSSEQLFKGNDAHIIERHYLIDHVGERLISKWYGK